MQLVLTNGLIAINSRIVGKQESDNRLYFPLARDPLRIRNQTGRVVGVIA